MKFLAAILFVIAGTVLITQAVYVAHLMWVWNPESALDKYERVKEDRIPLEKTLEELIREYETLRQTLGVYADEEKSPDETPKEGPVEQIKRLRALRSAIDKLESEERSLTRMRYYWMCGLLIVLVGCFISRRVSMLLALPFLIGGFFDMIAYSTLASQPVYAHTTERFLTYQFVLSIVTFMVLLIVTRVTGVFEVENELGER